MLKYDNDLDLILLYVYKHASVVYLWCLSVAAGTFISVNGMCTHLHIAIMITV